MEANPQRWPASPPAPVGDYESAAERLLEEVTRACEGGGDFPQRLEAALGAALELFAAEPELGRLLTSRPFEGDELALRRHERWQARFADLLREAAAESPEAHAHPPFVEPTLIAGIQWRVSRHVDRPESLPDLLPGLLEFVLSCYLEPHAELY